MNQIKRGSSRRGHWLGLALLVMASLLAGGCPKKLEQTPVAPDCEPAKVPPGSVGSWENPVKCYMPAGEQAYLRSLRGPDGKPALYRRTGNVGVGVNDNIVDRYEVQSRDGSVCVEIFMDMYYPGYVEKNPVNGFSMAGLSI